MKRAWYVEQESLLPVSSASVWAWVVTPEGINDEMCPWMTMSVPRGSAGITIDTIEIGRPIGRAWLRLFGIVPFDYDQLSIVELDAGRRFREESTMLSMRRWVHERAVQPVGNGLTCVRDRVTLEPRLPLLWAGPVLRYGIAAFFRHRHRRLSRLKIGAGGLPGDLAEGGDEGAGFAVADCSGSGID